MGERRRGTALPPRVELDEIVHQELVRQGFDVRSITGMIPWPPEAMADATAGPSAHEHVRQTLFGYPVEVIDGAEPGEFILRSVEPRVHITIPVRESVARRLEEDASLRERVEAELLAGLQEEIHRMVAEQVDELARGARTIAIARGILP